MWNVALHVMDAQSPGSQSSASGRAQSSVSAGQSSRHPCSLTRARSIGAAEREQAFRALRRVQEPKDSDRERSVEWPVRSVEEVESHSNEMSFVTEAPDPLFLRAFELTARGLGDRITSANVMATIHMHTRSHNSDLAVDRALSVLAQVISLLDDPRSELEVMHDAYMAGISNGDDPNSAVEALLAATHEAIGDADYPVRAIQVLVDGLSVEPAGYPPPTPDWLVPE